MPGDDHGAILLSSLLCTQPLAAQQWSCLVPVYGVPLQGYLSTSDTLVWLRKSAQSSERVVKSWGPASSVHQLESILPGYSYGLNT